MGSGARRSAVRVDGKDVRGATKSADHHPTAVVAETDVLHLGEQPGHSEHIVGFSCDCLQNLTEYEKTFS